MSTPTATYVKWAVELVEHDPNLGYGIIHPPVLLADSDVDDYVQNILDGGADCYINKVTIH